MEFAERTLRDWLESGASQEMLLAILEFELRPPNSRIDSLDWFGLVVEKIWRHDPLILNQFVTVEDEHLASSLLELVPDPDIAASLAVRLSGTKEDILQQIVLRRIWASSLDWPAHLELEKLVNRFVTDESRSGAVARLLQWRLNHSLTWPELLSALQQSSDEVREELLDVGPFLFEELGPPPDEVVKFVFRIVRTSSENTKMAAEDALMHWEIEIPDHNRTFRKTFRSGYGDNFAV
jgi:hypothetical protein